MSPKQYPESKPVSKLELQRLGNVLELCTIVIKEAIDERAPTDELFNFNLPDAYGMIAAIYKAMGESGRLERAKEKHMWREPEG